MTTSDAIAAWTSFLETTPPNTPVTIPDLAQPRRHMVDVFIFPTPQIQLHCEHDDGHRRFDPAKQYPCDISKAFTYHFIQYICRDCQTASKMFALLIHRTNATNVEAIKLGEYPPFSTPISSRLQRLLSKPDLELYRKGARAEAQGLGIGAATYFRRIVDEQWKLLVTQIRQAAK